MTSEQITQALDAYRDGTIAEPQAAELAAAIRAGGPDAAAILAAVANEGLIIQALDPVRAEDVVRMVRERVRAEGGRGSFVAAWRRRRQPAVTWRRWVAAAALMAAGIGAAVIGASQAFHPREKRPVTPSPEVTATNLSTTPAPIVEAVERATLRLPTGGPSPLIVGQNIAADAALDITEGGRVRLRHGDGTVIVLDGPARSAWSPDGTAERWTLEAGSLRADVTPRSSERSLTVRTAHGLIRVHGTRLCVGASPTTTTVAVEHGEVGVVPDVGSPLELKAGIGAVLTATGARRLPLTGKPLLAWDFSAATLDARWQGGQLDPGPADTPRRPCLAAQTFNDHGSMGFQLVDAAGLFTYADDVMVTISYWADPAIDHLDVWVCSTEAGTPHWYSARLPELSYGRWKTACVRLSELRPERADWPPLRVGEVVVNLSVNLQSVPGRLYFDDVTVAPMEPAFSRPLFSRPLFSHPPVQSP